MWEDRFYIKHIGNDWIYAVHNTKNIEYQFFQSKHDDEIDYDVINLYCMNNKKLFIKIGEEVYTNTTSYEMDLAYKGYKIGIYAGTKSVSGILIRIDIQEFAVYEPDDYNAANKLRLNTI